jgi:sugar lactone lactonase YvrE
MRRIGREINERLLAGMCLFSLLWGTSSTRADILAAHFFDGTITRWDEATGVNLGTHVTSGTAGLAGPSGMAFGPGGELFVSSQFTGEILYFDAATGAPLPSPLENGRDGLFASLGATSAPGLIRFGPDGNLYVGDTGGPNVRIVDGQSGLLLDDAVMEGVLADPGFTIGFTFDADGHLLVGKSSPIFQGTIYSVDHNGVTTEIVPPGTAGLQSVNSMLIGPGGELYVADLFGNQIMRFDDTSGTNPQQFAVIPPDIEFPLPTGAGFPSNFPSDMAFDDDGNLVLGVLGLTNPAMGGDNRGSILRYDLEGNLLQTLAMNISPVSAILLAPGSVPGDYNNDGLTEQGDLDLVLLHWGNDVNGLPAEWTNERPMEGVVDQTELDRILLNWGAGVAGTATTVPEPATLVLLLALAAAGLGIIRQKSLATE